MRDLTKILLLLLLFFVTSCAKDEDLGLGYGNESIYGFIEKVMDEWYLWNDMLPDVDITTYENPQDLVDAMTVEQDAWSFVDKTENVNAYFQEGEDFGFGFFLGWDEAVIDYSSSLRVMFIYENTQAYNKGIRRGWTLLEIDGTPVHELNSFAPFFDMEARDMQFKFRNSEGVETTIELSKETYKMNSVLYTNTYEVNSRNVGYIVYQSFLGYSSEELKSTFTNFKSLNLDELIVDLRYNQGGYISLAHEMVNTLVPLSSDGDVFITMKHNSDRSAEFDTSYHFTVTENNMDLTRVFFITNEYSASASELVINGLKPHMDVFSIGENTYGKPVAMYGFEHEDWLFYPVTAKSINADGYGDYFDGIAPDIEVFDNHHYNWGDLNDPALNQAFHFINFGTFNTQSIAIQKSSSSERNKDLMPDKLNRNLLLIEK